MNTLPDLWQGIRRSPTKALAHAFTAFSVIFTVVKAVNHFVPDITIEGPYALGAAILLSFGFGMKKVWKPSKIEICVSNCNAKIEVLFGDLFTQEGIRVVAVNEFFDSAIGKPVSDKSIHGMFLQKCFGGHPAPFDKQVEDGLKGQEYREVSAKVEGKNRAYPIGTTVMMGANQDQYLVFALSHSNVVTCKASADVTMMWIALNQVWQRARVECGGHPLSLPLVGSGLSGLGLPTRDLLNLIILSAITETKAKEITSRICIVLHRDRFNQLDLRDVKKHWEEK
jgi:hypothetical protein